MKSLCLMMAVLCVPAEGLAQHRPLKTELADTVERGTGLLEFGFEFQQDLVLRLSGLKGDRTRLGVIGLRLGAGENVEIHLDWTAQDFFNVDQRTAAPNANILDFAGNSTSDVGDLTLAAKVRLFREAKGRPAFGFRFGVELPNASNESGLGNDQTNFYSSFLLAKQFSKLRLVSNLGLAILGDPTAVSSQDDLVTYGLALIYPVHRQLNLVADLYGRAGPGGIGTEEQTLLRLGGQIRAAGVFWDFAVLAGLRDTDPSTGVIVGISKEFRLPSF